MSPHTERIDPALVDWPDLLDQRPVINGVDLVGLLNRVYQSPGTTQDVREGVLRVLTGSRAA